MPEHTLRALAEGNEFAAQYVLANILHTEGRGDDIRDSTFASTALSIAGRGASESGGDTGYREQSNLAVGTGTCKFEPSIAHNITAGQKGFSETESGLENIQGTWSGRFWPLLS